MIIIKSFLCISDARVRKILQAISINNKNVIYSGTYKCQNREMFEITKVEYNLLLRKNTFFCLIKTAFLDFQRLIKLNSKDTLYFVDEQIAIISIPLLIFLKFKKVKLVLDLFDSYYLKTNKNFIVFISLNLMYKLFDTIIVTDEERAKIMLPLIGNSKIAIIENFPFYNELKKNKKLNEQRVINLFFYGSLHESRGWQFINQFKHNDNYFVYLAGWDHFSDIDINNLPSNFKYIGLMNQLDILNFMNDKIDWVFCLYEPSNINNINASPNKVYDAIHTQCGIIINSEVRLSKFVNENKFGIVLNTYYDNVSSYFEQLTNFKIKTCNSKEELLNYSFDKYLNFYKSL
jgi:hypothetical protein